MSQLAAFNLSQWIEEHRELLRPPVGNARILPEGDFIVMAIGGPNLRTDYHDDPGEEIFFQLEGDMTLRVMEDSGPRDIPIREAKSSCCRAGCATRRSARRTPSAWWSSASAGPARWTPSNGIASPATGWSTAARSN